MKIDNFGLVKNLITFDATDNLYCLVTLIKRKKDVEGRTGSNKCTQMYFITSQEKLEQLKGEIILLSEYHCARAYINVSPKPYSKLQKEMLARLAKVNLEGNVINPIKFLMSCAEKCTFRQGSKWIVDVDDMGMDNEIRQYFNDKLIRIYAEIPTRNGKHFITTPFNLKEFNDTFPDIDVHKNSIGTLLYYPESIDSNKITQIIIRA